MKGTLYIVATPIGNLEDITLRAIRVLREVGLVAAEDTRRTGKLFQAHGIRTPLTSLHDWNERGKSASIMERLLAGTDVACVSDAGTPGISDPGYILVKTAIERGITIVPIPGPSAIITAVSVSGLPMDRFVFFGFLPSKGSQRRKFLASLSDEEKTMIFHESPRRLPEALADLEELLGNREIVVARELTKLHEEILRGTVSAVRDQLKDTPPRGEITLLVSGRAKKSLSPEPVEALRDRIRELAGKGGVSVRDMVARLTEETELPRSVVYRETLKILKKK